tara:strand:+ start:352 stop:591 length:240 start_codon:yes stop_codon:yes gene_type:complete
MAKIEKEINSQISANEFDLIVKLPSENEIITFDVQSVLGALEEVGWLDSHHCFSCGLFFRPIAHEEQCYQCNQSPEHIH